MIIEGINLDEFNVLYIADSEQPYCDFAVVLGYENDTKGALIMHVSREEIGEINGLIAKSDKITQKKDEENGYH